MTPGFLPRDSIDEELVHPRWILSSKGIITRTPERKLSLYTLKSL